MTTCLECSAQDRKGSILLTANQPHPCRFRHLPHGLHRLSLFFPLPIRTRRSNSRYPLCILSKARHGIRAVPDLGQHNQLGLGRGRGGLGDGLLGELDVEPLGGARRAELAQGEAEWAGLDLGHFGEYPGGVGKSGRGRELEAQSARGSSRMSCLQLGVVTVSLSVYLATVAGDYGDTRSPSYFRGNVATD